MRRNITKKFLLSIFLFALLFCEGKCEVEEEGSSKDSQTTVKSPSTINFRSRRSISTFYRNLPHDEDNEEYWQTVEREENEALENLLKDGPLEKRSFVVVEALPRSQKFVERTYRFETDDDDENESYLRGKRDDVAEPHIGVVDNTESSNEDENSEGTKHHEGVKRPEGATHLGRSMGRAMGEKDPHHNHDDSPESQLNDSVKDYFRKPPPGFNSSIVVIRYSHLLSKIERAGDTKAKLGDQCQTTSMMEPDYCEMAAFPNKNKMVCNGVDDPVMNSTITKNTCTCKFYRVIGVSENEVYWKQMKKANLSINNETVEVCLVPKFGVCNHRIGTGHHDISGNPVYEVDLCQGHFQCDNSKYFSKLKEKENGTSVITVTKHCTEDDFINLFEHSVHSDILLCSKPNSRRFKKYDEFKFYCLPESARDPAKRSYEKTSIDNVDLDEDADILQSH